MKKTNLTRELCWFAGIVLATVLIGRLILPRIWLGAFWVYPVPNSRGPVWVNVNSHPLKYLVLFLVIFLLVYAVRLIVRFIRKSKGRNDA
jgi:hypothetical protein